MKQSCMFIISFLNIYKKIKIVDNLILNLCDFVNVIPGFSYVTFAMADYPQVDFDILFRSGSLSVRRIPKISKIVEPFLKRGIFASFVYPRTIGISLKSREIQNLRSAGKLIKYGQLSKISEGSIEVCWESILLCKLFLFQNFNQMKLILNSEVYLRT